MKKTKSIQFFKDPGIHGVEISKVEDSSHIFPKHAHDGIFAFSLITSGASYCLGEERTDLSVNTGEIVALNPGQIHSGVPKDNQPISYWMLYTDIDTMAGFAGDILKKKGVVPVFNNMVIQDHSLATHFLNLLKSYERNSKGLKKQALLKYFFNSLLQHTCKTKQADNTPGSTSDTINLARDYLSENLDMGISLDTVAKKVGFSRFHFIRQFKRHTGVSPHQFRIQRRIEAAKCLIRNGRPFSQVALETGFVDQSHFTNKFRQYTGATPSQYARLQN